METMEDLAQWNVTPGETFTAPPSPPSSLIKPTDPQEPKLEPEKDGLTGKYCGHMFKSQKTTVCTRTARLTFPPPHMCAVTDFSDVIIGPVETDSQAEENVNEDCPVSRKEESNASALNGKASNEGKSMFQKPRNAVKMQD